MKSEKQDSQSQLIIDIYQLRIKKLAIIKMLWKVILVVLLFTSSMKLTAQGDLLIFPKRIVFDETKKYYSINLSNSGKDTARYTISFVQIRMKEDGSFENITIPDSNQHFAEPYLRIFPRSVILGPGEGQVVRVQLQKTDQLTMGEYRSHLYFRAMPDVQPLGEEETKKDTTSISVKLIPVFGITVPIIIRKGKPSATVSLSNLSFQKSNDSIPIIKVDFKRSGDCSVYGNIRVNLILPNGKIYKVGDIDGFAVYAPGTLRKCIVELKKGMDYTKGKLIVSYSAPAEERGLKLAEAELELCCEAISKK